MTPVETITEIVLRTGLADRTVRYRAARMGLGLRRQRDGCGRAVLTLTAAESEALVHDPPSVGRPPKAR
jgi:hypothetical protein